MALFFASIPRTAWAAETPSTNDRRVRSTRTSAHHGRSLSAHVTEEILIHGGIIAGRTLSEGGSVGDVADNLSKAARKPSFYGYLAGMTVGVLAASVVGFHGIAGILLSVAGGALFGHLGMTLASGDKPSSTFAHMNWTHFIAEVVGASLGIAGGLALGSHFILPIIGGILGGLIADQVLKLFHKSDHDEEHDTDHEIVHASDTGNDSDQSLDKVGQDTEHESVSLVELSERMREAYKTFINSDDAHKQEAFVAYQEAVAACRSAEDALAFSN